MSNEQLLKKHFPRIPVKERKTWLKSLNSLPPEQVTKAIELLKKQTDEQAEKILPILLESIIYNSLGYEKNEILKESCYNHHHNKKISKFAKHFIDGQYMVFRNENEKILNDDNGTTTSDLIQRTEDVISLLVDTSIKESNEWLEVLEALKKDRKSVLGIVKKVNKK